MSVAAPVGGGAALFVPSGVHVMLANLRLGRGSPLQWGPVREARETGSLVEVLAGSRDSPAWVTLMSAVLHNNSVAGMGGCIRVSGVGGTAIVRNSILQGCAADADGGAVAVVSGAELVVLRSLLAGNAAKGDGGAVTAGIDTAVAMLDTSLINNTAGDSGGALSAVAANLVFIARTVARGNVASESGGAMSLVRTGQPVTLGRVEVHDNCAGLYGGGLSINTGALLEVTVTGNTAGVAVHTAEQCKVVATAVRAQLAARFGDDDDDGGGGGGGAAATAAVLQQVPELTPTGDGGGCAIAAATTVVNVQFSHFENNVAAYGGGISRRGLALINATTSTIVGNIALAAGGGMYSAGPGLTLLRSAVTVANNTAGERGGGVACDACSLTAIGDTLVTGNRVPTATGDVGGGIAVTTPSINAPPVRLGSTTVLRDNRAPVGGAVAVTSLTGNATRARRSRRRVGNGRWPNPAPRRGWCLSRHAITGWATTACWCPTAPTWRG